MARYSFLIIAVLLPFLSVADPSDLINFDDPASKRYLKSHTIISATLDKDYNFRKEGGGETIYCLNDVVSNFSPDRINKFYLKIKYENWIYDWMKENQDLRLFFNIDHNTGIPKLMGYSNKKLNINQASEGFDHSLVSLKDFTNIDVSVIEEGTYVVGTINPDFDKVYPVVFKNAIVLGYPSDLKWRNINSYIGSYKLNKPISVGLIHAVVSSKVHQVVLKKVGDKYEVCGYVRPASLDMPME